MQEELSDTEVDRTMERNPEAFKEDREMSPITITAAN